VYVAFSLAGPGGTNRWIARTAVLASDAWLHVLDRRYETELTAAHVGEVVYPRVLDAASDLTDAQDEVEVTVSGLPGGPRTVRLGETFGHSGVFKGALTLRFAGEAAAGTAAPDTLAVNYGNELSFACARPGAAAPLRSALRIHKGADGAVAPFTKQFRDPEIAVQTQFTAAEAYFEMAKKHRELGQKDVAHREIAQGRKLLEEALRDSPKSEARAHADYLLAELSLQFAEEASDPAERQRCCLDAISRFTEIVATFPESPQAPKSQFKKALAFEKMGQIDQACEEYVKLSYRYPENELVAETIARLGNYFTVKNRELADKAKAQTSPVEVEKLMTQARASATTAAQVFGRLFERFPDHPLAWKTQVLSGQCYMRAENYDKAVEVFKRVVTAQKAEPDLIGQAMYWCGDCHMKSKRLVEAYQAFKKLTWDYPESVWAKYARGRLSEEALSQIEEQDAGGGK
jgi:TolA-binding protein